MPDARIRLETYIQLDIYLSTTCLHIVLQYLDPYYDNIFQTARYILSIKSNLIDNIALCEKLNDSYIRERDELILSMSELFDIDLGHALCILEQ